MVLRNKMTYTAIIMTDTSVYGEVFHSSHDRSKAWEAAYDKYGSGLTAIVTGSHIVYSSKYSSTNQGSFIEEQ